MSAKKVLNAVAGKIVADRREYEQYLLGLPLDDRNSNFIVDEFQRTNEVPADGMFLKQYMVPRIVDYHFPQPE